MDNLAKFWARDKDATIIRIKEKFPNQVDESLRIADEVLANTFTFQDVWEMERSTDPVVFTGDITDIPWSYRPGEDEEWTFAFSRQTFLVHLAKAWAYTENKKYLDQFHTIVEDWITREPLTEESKFSTWRSIEAGLRCENWLRALKILSGTPGLNPDIVKIMEDALLQHGEYLVETYTGFHALSNWGVIQDHGLFLLSLYFNREDWQALAIRRLDKNIHHAVFRDGSQFEQSPMYHCEVLHCVANTVLLARQNHIDLPKRFVEKVRKMFLALHTWTKPNGYLFCQSDSDEIMAGDLLMCGALLYQEETLAYRAQGELFEQNYWDFGLQAETLLASLPTMQGVTSQALTDSGNYLLLANEKHETGYVRFHLGRLGGGHGHVDQLHISAGIKGEDFLIDSGRYTYVENSTRLQLKEASAHNLVRIDGEDFTEVLNSWGFGKRAVPLPAKHVYTEKVDYVHGAHLGYLHKGIVPVRKLVFVKEANLLFIMDLFYGEGEHLYEQFWQIGNRNYHLHEHTIYLEGNDASCSLHFLDKDVDITVNPSLYSLRYNELLDGKRVCVSRTTAGFYCMPTILSLNTSSRVSPIQWEEHDVLSTLSDITLSRDKVRGYSVCKEGKEYTFLFVFTEPSTQNNLMETNGFKGYGNIIVYMDGEEDGICLDW